MKIRAHQSWCNDCMSQGGWAGCVSAWSKAIVTCSTVSACQSVLLDCATAMHNLCCLAVCRNIANQSLVTWQMSKYALWAEVCPVHLVVQQYLREVSRILRIVREIKTKNATYSLLWGLVSFKFTFSRFLRLTFHRSDPYHVLEIMRRGTWIPLLPQI